MVLGYLIAKKRCPKIGANDFGLGEVPPLETKISSLTILRHFAKPVLWDSFKNLLGLALNK